MYEDRKAPIQEGQEYDVEIESVGEKGDGIAKVKGFVLFVAGTKKGDLVRVKVTKVLTNVGFAEVVKKLEKLEKPAGRSKKFATVNPDDLKETREEINSGYEDTEDFGEDLEVEE